MEQMSFKQEQCGNLANPSLCYIECNTRTPVGVPILISMVTVIPQASWLSSSWSLKEMEGSASSMMTAMPPINQSEPCSCLTAGRHVITEMETYGTQHSVDIYLNFL